MKKAVLVACCLSFCSVSVSGMPVDRRGSGESPLLEEYRGNLEANPPAKSEKNNVHEPDNRGKFGEISAKSERNSVHKRKLSHSEDGKREVQKPCRRREDSAGERVLTDLERLVGLRKRVEKKEEEIEEKKKEIEKKEKEIEERDLTIRTASGRMDFSMRRYKEQTGVSRSVEDLYYGYGGDIVGKIDFLMPLVISKVSELQDKNAKNEQEILKLKKDRDVGAVAVQKLQKEDIENKSQIRELQKKNIENKAEIKELRGQIDQLNQVLQSRGNGIEQSKMDVDEGENLVVLAGSMNGFPAQEMSGGRNVVEARLPAVNSMRDVVAAENESRFHEERTTVSANNNEVAGGNVEMFENKRLGIKIQGRFVDGYLDFSRPVSFKGCYVKEQEFIFLGPGSEKIKISKKDLSRVERVRGLDGCLSLLSSEEESSAIFCKKFVYKGVVDGNGKPNGSGVVLKSTGEILEGKFSPNDLGEWLQ